MTSRVLAKATCTHTDFHTTDTDPTSWHTDRRILAFRQLVMPIPLTAYGVYPLPRPKGQTLRDEV